LNRRRADPFPASIRCQLGTRRQLSHHEEDILMTHTPRLPLYRPIVAAVFAAAILASSLPAQAQYRRGGYHGRPQPQYHGRDYRGRDRGGNGGALIAGALLGVIAGTAIANSNSNSYVPQPPPNVVYQSAPPPPPPGVVYYDNNNGY
jgi:hypothetical protein